MLSLWEKILDMSLTHPRSAEKKGSKKTTFASRCDVDDFLIGLADGDTGDKWMSQIMSLYRW